MRRTLTGMLTASAFGLAATLGTASAQALSPMKAEVSTVSDYAAFRLNVRNPYDKAGRFQFMVYDTAWNVLENARLSTQQMSVAPYAKASLLVLAPVETKQDFYVCVTSQPFWGAGAALRGRVCGKYTALRQAS